MRRRKDADGDAPPSDTLWVGSVPSDAADTDLMGLFGEYGALDCVAMHGGRSYAFAFFRNIDDARAAKEALQGAKLLGSSMKIDFARPAKPCKHLWVGGIGSSITKEQLEEEFMKFGKIEEIKLLRERNSAFIDYSTDDEAIAAQKNLDGKSIAGEPIRVDYLRPQPSRKEWPDRYEPRDVHFGGRNMRQLEPWMSPDGFRDIHDPHNWSMRLQADPYGRRDGPPSNILWVGHPPSVQIDEQMLHNAMILFGEIERVRCFPGKNYAFVKFRSVDEARRAKEGLQGRLFNDPRIQILYANSDNTASMESAMVFQGYRAHRPDIPMREPSLVPGDLLASGRPLGSNNIHGFLPPSGGLSGPNMLTRPFDVHINRGESEFHDFEGASNDFPDEFGGLPHRFSNRRRHSPTSLLVHGGRTPFRHSHGAWEANDMRETKRSRVDDFNNDLSWRGLIAKGGTHVCYARCVPIGSGIDAPFPDVVNCSARTGLDMLTKYYAEANGFEIVFFLPDSEDDFASYTEFLRYLGLKNRAGVAKLEDGTTLFLVPPSNFLTNVLKVSGPERLYGVVLKLPQQLMAETVQQSQAVLPPPPAHHVDHPQAPNLESVRNFVPQSEMPAVKVDYSRPLQEVHNAGTGNALIPRSEAPPTQPPDYTNNTKVSLTPELIATLASLIPGKSLPIANGAAKLSEGPSANPSQLLSGTVNDGLVQSQGWAQEYQNQNVMTGNIDQPSNVHPQLVNQPNSQAPQSSLYLPYANAGSGVDFSLAGTQFQDPSFNVVHGSSIPAHNYSMTTHGGQFVPPQSNQQYQLEYNNAATQQADVAGAFNYSVLQQLNPVVSGSIGGHMSNLSQAQYSAPLPVNKIEEQFPSQVQQLQPVYSAPGQAAPVADAEKNTRYQSTLQFAANLLLQIQQQQQGNSSAMQGSGNQQ